MDRAEPRAPRASTVAANEHLHYVADPMCSWCWGFTPVLEALEPELRLPVERVLGGLAPESSEPMDEDTRRYVQRAWRSVEARTGASFDHSFWDHATPRRSTYPACRAVLAAGERGDEMFAAIQRAYYLEARDPSDKALLARLGAELGFDEAAFADAIDDEGTRARLAEHLALRDSLGVRAYPSLVLERDRRVEYLTQGWTDAATLRAALQEHDLLREGSRSDSTQG